MAQVQYAEVMEKMGIQNYLLLENSKGEQEIWMTYEDLSVRSTTFLKYQYRADPSGKRHLQPLSLQALFVLAYSELRSKTAEGYQIARWLLQLQNVGEEKDQDIMLKWTEKIFLLNETEEDRDPRAVACRLQAYDLYRRYAKKFNSVFTKETCRRLRCEIELYQDKIQRFPAFRLEPGIIEDLQTAANAYGELVAYLSRPAAYDVEKIKAWSPTLIQEMADAFQTTHESPEEEILYTRPGRKMLSLLFKKLPDAFLGKKHPRKKDLRRLLSVARQDQDIWSQCLRSALEEICDHPATYAHAIPHQISQANVKELLETVLFPASMKMAGRIRESSKFLIRPIDRPGVKRRAQPGPSAARSCAPDALTAHASQAWPPSDFAPLQLQNFIEEKLQGSGPTSLEEGIKRLQALFSKPFKSSGLEAKEFLRLQSDLEVYCDSQTRDLPALLQLKAGGVPELMHKLELQVSYRQRQEAELERQLVKAVNDGGFDPTAQKIAWKLSGEHDTFSLQDILIFYARQELQQVCGAELPKVAAPVQMADLWDPQLKISFNVATHRALGLMDRIAQPFDTMQKPAPYALLKRNRLTKEWELCLLDQTDAEFFIKALRSARQRDACTKWDSVLYELHQGIIEPGPGTLSESDIRSSKPSRLLAQAKFFNGMTNFSKEEETELRTWIAEKGEEKMFRLFRDKIVKHRGNAPLLVERLGGLV